MVSRLVVLLAVASAITMTATAPQVQTTPIAFGEPFTMPSKVLGETRRINVYVPPLSGETPDARRPVLYMPDGGMAEDFLHIAGLLQVSLGNGTVRPVILVGIENTERRRDLSGPTGNPVPGSGTISAACAPGSSASAMPSGRSSRPSCRS